MKTDISRVGIAHSFLSAGVVLRCRDTGREFVAVGITGQPFTLDIEERKVPVVHSKSEGRRAAVTAGFAPDQPDAFIPAFELSELRRKAALWDKAKGQDRLFLVELAPDGSALVETLAGARRRINCAGSI